MSTEKSDEPTAIVLQRETILPTSDRGRLAAIIATCSMAGLAGGMALSMLAESQRVADELRREQAKASMRLAEEEALRTPITWLGVTIKDAGKACAGAQIEEIVPGSPADRAGFRSGDVVDTFGSDAVCDDEHLISVVRISAIGATPAITVRRGAEHLTLHPKLGVMPPRFRR